VYATAAKARHFTRRIETGDGLAVESEGAGGKVGLNAAQRFSGQDVQLHTDEGPGLWVEDAVRCGGASDAVAQVPTGVADALDLVRTLSQ
jgi:hypothetical protein